MPWSVPNNLPPSIRGLPIGAQKLWVAAANSVLSNGGTDEDAVKAGWANVKRKYKKAGDKWIKKKYGGVDELPKNVKQLPPIAQRVWMFLYNQQKDEGKSNKKSAEHAWIKIKQKYKWNNENQIWTIKENVVDKPLIIENRKTDLGIFKTWIPFDFEEDGKVAIHEKNIGGKKRKYFHGQASNTQIDKENERVSPSFIKKMKDTALGMNVFAEHQHTIEKTLGFVEEVGGSGDVFEAYTLLEPEEDNELVKTILTKIGNGIKFGYSVGGRVTKVSKSTDDDGKQYVSLDDGDLYELSVTPMPAGKDTWVTPLVKSMREVIDEREDWSGEIEDKEETGVNKVVLKDDQNGSGEGILKALKEMMESEDIKDQIYRMFWSFQRAIRQVIDGDLEPAAKKAKIKKVSAEFGGEIESLSGKLAALVQKIEEQL